MTELLITILALTSPFAITVACLYWHHGITQRNATQD